MSCGEGSLGGVRDKYCIPFEEALLPKCGLFVSEKSIRGGSVLAKKIFSLINYQKQPQHLGRNRNLFRSMIFNAINPYGKSSNKEMGKKVGFHHNKDNFCSSFFILTTNLAKNRYFKNKKSLYSHFSGKTKSFT